MFSLFSQVELPVSEKYKLFDTLVGSILNYSAEIIGAVETKDIELVHTNSCRWILHVRKSTNLTGLYGELGRVFFVITRKIRMIKYWAKLLKLDANAIPKKIYFMLRKDAENNVTYNRANLASQVKSLLDELGLTYIWVQQDDINIPCDFIQQRIMDMYKQSWYANINNSFRLFMCARIKHEYEMEHYLDFITEKNVKLLLQNLDCPTTT